MKDFRLYNRLLGWLVMLISAFVYLSTIEPTTSLWDCGEFIASAYKLQVGHPPGAPLFMIMAKFFSLFAGNDVAKVALMINSMSALVSAFTIMFLFWTISHLGLKLIDTSNMNLAKTVAVLGSSLVGALAYTFSDTFWFSAVEGEVYASSSLFTAVVFWAILKWENEANQKYANRWIVLIAYLMGLSIGVHLLNLLAIPAIVLVFYFKKYETTPRGVIIALLVSVVLLGGVMYGIIPGIVKVASKFELFFVNSVGLPFNSGVIIYALLLISLITAGIYFSHKENFSITRLAMIVSFSLLLAGIYWTKAGLIINIPIALGVGYLFKVIFEKRRDVLNTLLLCCAVIILGYSSFSMIVIRSLANPPMDENSPETVFSLQSYLNREQYGEHPLVYGRCFNNMIAVDKKITGAVYHKAEDKYVKIQDKEKYKFSPEYSTIFPRMYSPQESHIQEYFIWGNIEEGDVYQLMRDQEGNVRTDRNGQPMYDRGRPNEKPKFSQNLRFFFKYQIGHMYFRYFFWNFVGRQNNYQSTGGPLYGNAITGFNFIDKKHVGDINDMPPEMKKHKARNVYYMLPLILGLIGMGFHYLRHKKDFWIVFILFILTGIAIVIYLNQTPLQPRERDYAYAGSFYAFAIWIGLGVMAVIQMIDKKMKYSIASIAVTGLTLFLVPGIMAKENWDDHDRSGRYMARDVAYNYLNSCAPNAILFTNGDNDTFPLWYAQEVEGIRTDVRVVNLMLLNMDWYIEQMTRKAYESDPLPISLELKQYLGNKRDRFVVESRKDTALYLKDIINYIGSDEVETKSRDERYRGEDCSPVQTFIIPVDSARVIQNKTVKAKDANLIAKEIKMKFPLKEYSKSDLIVLDILANNNWERPIYYVSDGHNATFGLEDYYQLDGFAYRLVPVKTEAKSRELRGRIDTDIMYSNFMENFKYGRMNADDVYMDNFHLRTLRVLMFRHRFARLADALASEGKFDKAEKVLDKVVDLTPHDKIPFEPNVLSVCESYYKIGAYAKGNKIIMQYNEIIAGHLNFYLKQNDDLLAAFNSEIRQNLGIFHQNAVIVENKNQKEVEKQMVGILDNLNSYQLEYMMPLTMYMQLIARPYYMLGAFETGNEKFMTICNMADNYLSSELAMNPEGLSQSFRQIYITLSLLEEISVTAQQYGQIEMANYAKNIFDEHNQIFERYLNPGGGV